VVVVVDVLDEVFWGGLTEPVIVVSHMVSGSSFETSLRTLDQCTVSTRADWGRAFCCSAAAFWVAYFCSSFPCRWACAFVCSWAFAWSSSLCSRTPWRNQKATIAPTTTTPIVVTMPVRRRTRWRCWTSRGRRLTCVTSGLLREERDRRRPRAAVRLPPGPP